MRLSRDMCTSMDDSINPAFRNRQIFKDLQGSMHHGWVGLDRPVDRVPLRVFVCSLPSNKRRRIAADTDTREVKFYMREITMHTSQVRLMWWPTNRCSARELRNHGLHSYRLVTNACLYAIALSTSRAVLKL